MYYPNKSRNCCRTELNPCGVPEPFGVQDCSSDAKLIRCCPAIESLTDGNETLRFAFAIREMRIVFHCSSCAIRGLFNNTRQHINVWIWEIQPCALNNM